MKSKSKIIVIASVIVLIVIGIIFAVIFFTHSELPREKKQSAYGKNSDISADRAEDNEDDGESAESAKEEPSAQAPDISMPQVAKDTCYAVYFFNTGAFVSSGNSQKVPSASVIKVFIMEYIFDEIKNGNTDENAAIGGQSLRSLVERMIQNSDNNATNILIDHFGMDSINRFISEAGYQDTSLGRRMLDFDAQKNGQDNYTSLDDTMAFLKKLYKNRNIYPYNEMLGIMKGQNVRTKIPLYLPSGTAVANKTGELPTVENDIGIVFSENGDFAISVLANNIYSSSEARQAIGKLAKDAYDCMAK